MVCGGADLGWSCLACDLTRLGSPPTGAPDCGASTHGDARVVPRDAFGRRAYLQPLGLLLESDGARMAQLDVRWRPGGKARAGSVTVRLLPAFDGSTHALLSLSADGTHAPGERAATLRCADGGRGQPRACAFAAMRLPGARGMVNVSLAGDETELHIDIGSAEALE